MQVRARLRSVALGTAVCGCIAQPGAEPKPRGGNRAPIEEPAVSAVERNPLAHSAETSALAMPVSSNTEPTETALAPTVPSDAPAATPKQAKVAVAIEPVYRVGARPVPEAPIDASAHDTLLGAWNQGGGSDPAFSTNRPGYHPATRVIIDTKVLSGRGSLGQLTPRAILARTRERGYWPFRLCLEEGIHGGTDLRGAAVLRFSIDQRGRVSYARRIKSDFSRDVSDCLRRATYKPEFSPAPRRRVDVELSARLSAGDVTLPHRDPPGATPEDLGAAQSALGEATPSVAACCRAGTLRDPELWGRVELELGRDARGAIVDARERSSRFPDASVTECIEGALLGRIVEAAPGPNVVVAWRLGTWSPP